MGSRAVHSASQDCIASSNPIYSGNGITECYWTEKRFSGWLGGQPSAGSYNMRLQGLGF